MANQPANPPAHGPAAAHVVGNAFVNQYYNVLHQSPQVVHRFYTDASRLTRAEAGADGAVDTVGTQKEIHLKVMSSNYNEFKAEIKTVDSQDSHGGGVLVLVTGSLSTKSSDKRNFVQSFFLAPQEKGYFVLNDIFRYLDVETQQPKPVPAPPAPIAAPEPAVVHQPAPEPAVEQQAPVPEPEEVAREIPSASETEAPAEEVYDHSEAAAASEGEEEDGVVENNPTAAAAVAEVPESPSVQFAPAAAAANVNEPESSGEAPKKHSYASILKVYGTPIKAAPQPAPERPAATSSPSPAPAPAAAPAPAPPSLVEEAQEKIAPVENEADGRSIYVKNLPMTITAAELEKALTDFGQVKAGGVNVKNQKPGVCYAFVEFEAPTGAQNAIEASPISIQGRQVYIEEKRTMGRGPRRPSDNRSERPYRPEGGRGRGAYGGGGRGAYGGGRGGMDGGGRGGRGTGPPRNHAYPNSNGTSAPPTNSYGSSGGGQRQPRRNPTSGGPPPRATNGSPTPAAPVATNT